MAAFIKPIYLSDKDGNRDNLYQALGVAPNASANEIKKSYRKLLRQLHPDSRIGGALLNQADRDQLDEAFKELNNINRILSDPQERQIYDGQLAYQAELPKEWEVEAEEKRKKYKEAEDRLTIAKDKETAENKILAEAKSRRDEANKADEAVTEALRKRTLYTPGEDVSEEDKQREIAALEEELSQRRDIARELNVQAGAAEREATKVKQAREAEAERIKGEDEQAAQAKREREGGQQEARPRSSQRQEDTGSQSREEYFRQKREQRRRDREREEARKAEQERQEREAAERAAAEREAERRRLYPTRAEQEEDLFEALRRHREAQSLGEPTRDSEDLLRDIRDGQDGLREQREAEDAELRAKLADEEGMQRLRTEQEREASQHQAAAQGEKEDYVRRLQEEEARPSTPEERLLRWARKRLPNNRRLAENEEAPRQEQEATTGSSENRG